MRRRRRDARVEGHGDLHEDQRATMLNPTGEAFIEAAGFNFAGANGDLNACRAERVETPTGDGWIGIDGGCDDAAHS